MPGDGMVVVGVTDGEGGGMEAEAGGGGQGGRVGVERVAED